MPGGASGRWFWEEFCVVGMSAMKRELKALRIDGVVGSLGDEERVWSVSRAGRRIRRVGEWWVGAWVGGGAGGAGGAGAGAALGGHSGLVERLGGVRLDTGGPYVSPSKGLGRAGVRRLGCDVVKDLGRLFDGEGGDDSDDGNDDDSDWIVEFPKTVEGSGAVKRPNKRAICSITGGVEKLRKSVRMLTVLDTNAAGEGKHPKIRRKKKKERPIPKIKQKKRKPRLVMGDELPYVTCVAAPIERRLDMNLDVSQPDSGYNAGHAAGGGQSGSQCSYNTDCAARASRRPTAYPYLAEEADTACASVTTRALGAQVSAGEGARAGTSDAMNAVRSALVALQGL